MNTDLHHSFGGELIAPYGGRLIDLLVPGDALEALKAEAVGMPSLQISERSVCDLELLATGAFSPLDRFMGSRDYASVLESMRLADGRLFPVPVTLPVSPADTIHLGRRIALRSPKNELLALMTVEEIYPWNVEEAVSAVLGTRDLRHPLAAEMHTWGRLQVTGEIRVLALPTRHDFLDLRLTPSETRAALAKAGRRNVVAFQTRNPMHRVHEEMTRRAAASVDGTLLIHPAVGMTKPGDIDHYTRVRTYCALANLHAEPGRVLLALVPLAMRLAGPREALWHALIRRNYGANHFIVGRDHASPGKDSHGRPFYGPYDAAQLVARHSEELGVRAIPFEELLYLPDEDRYEEASRIPPHVRTDSISGSQVRDEYLGRGIPLPPWFVRPEVAAILGEAYPPRHRQGACIWFTGLSGAGKSTTADVLTVLLLEHGRQVTVLDGDVVRTHLSQGLGFSKEDRDANIRRMGFVAAEIVRHGGMVVCAAVSPYRATRNEVRAMSGDDRFVEVFVDTPLEVCEARDTKGMYAKARSGVIQGFTGIDDPYEPPLHPEIRLDTSGRTAKENARLILEYLQEKGFVRSAPRTASRTEDASG